MPHENILDRAQTALIIVDMQEAFRSTISDFSEIAARIALIAHAVQVLDVPVIVTEQYPKGLGHTAGEIQAVLPPGLTPIIKTAFSACGAESFEDQLIAAHAVHVLLCGIEAHICVNQTAHDLLEAGYKVHFLTDCITARAPQNKQLAFSKMQQSGALPTTTEMALFELMRDARHAQFKTIQNLIK
jgi:nicotinamidase-related amidase